MCLGKRGFNQQLLSGKGWKRMKQPAWLLCNAHSHHQLPQSLATACESERKRAMGKVEVHYSTL